jgi:hypothetical protein
MESQTAGTEKTQALGSDMDSSSMGSAADPEEIKASGGFRNLRLLLDKVRQSQKPVASRRELSRDKSKSLFLLVGAHGHTQEAGYVPGYKWANLLCEPTQFSRHPEAQNCFAFCKPTTERHFGTGA